MLVVRFKINLIKAVILISSKTSNDFHFIMPNHSDIPFQHRDSYRECARAWCMNERGSHGKIIDWQGTRYWGERRVVVRWFKDGSLTEFYCESAIDESLLTPLDVSKNWEEVLEHQKSAFVAKEEKLWLDYTLQKTIDDKPLKRL